MWLTYEHDTLRSEYEASDPVFSHQNFLDCTGPNLASRCFRDVGGCDLNLEIASETLIMRAAVEKGELTAGA